MHIYCACNAWGWWFGPSSGRCFTPGRGGSSRRKFHCAPLQLMSGVGKHLIALALADRIHFGGLCRLLLRLVVDVSD